MIPLRPYFLLRLFVSKSPISVISHSVARADERPRFSVKQRWSHCRATRTTLGDSYTRSNAGGSRRGTVEPNAWCGYTLRNEKGEREGYASPSTSGGYVVRDETGKRLQSIEPTPYGGFVIRDNAGKRVGTIQSR